MGEKNIKAILFDLGNVLIKLDPDAVEKGYAAYAKIKEGEMVQHIMDSELMNAYMEGKITSEKFYKRTKKLFRMDIGLKEFYRIWNSMFHPYPEMEDLIKTIRAKYPALRMVLVSNTNEAHYEFIKQEFSVLKLLDEFLVSHEFGIQKPDPAIYLEALRIAGTLPKETFYADDRADLVEAARILGIHAFQFTCHEELRAQLAKCGIIT